MALILRMSWKMRLHQNIFVQNKTKNTITILPVITATFPVGIFLVALGAQQHKGIMVCA